MADKMEHSIGVAHGSNAKSLFLNVPMVLDFSMSSDSGHHVRGGSLRIWHGAVGEGLNYFTNFVRIVKLTLKI